MILILMSDHSASDLGHSNARPDPRHANLHRRDRPLGRGPGPVVTDKVTYSGSQRLDGTFDVTMTSQVLPGYPHAKDVPVPADL